MSAFWKRVGLVLAKVGQVAVQGALWASAHPQVIAAVGAIAVSKGANPGVVAGIEQGASIAGQVVQAAEQK